MRDSRLYLSQLIPFIEVELEFFNFQTPTEDGYGESKSSPNLGAFLSKNSPKSVRPVGSGMFGYSTIKPLENKGYFHRIFDVADEVNCQIEGWHTESGPGVFEAVSCDFTGS